jgi:hypothetical protein
MGWRKGRKAVYHRRRHPARVAVHSALDVDILARPADQAQPLSVGFLQEGSRSRGADGIDDPMRLVEENWILQTYSPIRRHHSRPETLICLWFAARWRSRVTAKIVGCPARRHR